MWQIAAQLVILRSPEGSLSTSLEICFPPIYCGIVKALGILRSAQNDTEG